MQKRIRNGAIRSVQAAAMFAFVAGCGGDDDDLGSMADSFLNELTEQSEIYCACHQEFGYSSRSECLNDGLTLGPSMRECVKDALAQNEEASKNHLSCVVALERDFTECLDDRWQCSSLDSDGPCFDDYDVGFQNCPPLPSSVDRELDDCGF